MENIESNDWVICKACGYRMRYKNLKDVCPACGVNRKFFEPFTDNISQVRRSLLELHVHPIVVHFSVALSVLLFLTIFISIFTGGRVSEALYGTSTVISIVLPFFVLGGLLSGIIDGIARFKKIKRPVLLNKIYLSILFLLLSIAILVIIRIFGYGTLSINILLLILAIFAAGSGTLLGKLGGPLTGAILPGK